MTETKSNKHEKRNIHWLFQHLKFKKFNQQFALQFKNTWHCSAKLSCFRFSKIKKMELLMPRASNSKGYCLLFSFHSKKKSPPLQSYRFQRILEPTQALLKSAQLKVLESLLRILGALKLSYGSEFLERPSQPMTRILPTQSRLRRGPFLLTRHHVFLIKLTF